MKRTFVFVVVFLLGTAAGAFAAKRSIDSKSFSIDSGEFWNTINVAGSYVGVKPQ